MAVSIYPPGHPTILSLLHKRLHNLTARIIRHIMIALVYDRILARIYGRMFARK